MIRHSNDMLRTEALWAGLRLTADEFLALADDGFDYELVDGVVMMTPAPTPGHQDTVGEILAQLRVYLRNNPIGKALVETDVILGHGPSGGDLVYRPEVVYYRHERLPGMKLRLVGPPDVVVEVISPGSRGFDTRTKKDDYERAGVGEYWLIDPDRETFTFYRLEGGRFIEASFEERRFPSEAVPGFVLDLERVRETFAEW